MHIQVKLPINIFCDNVGAIQMVRNNASGTGTRHINVRYHFVRDLLGEIIKLYYMKSEHNEAGILTKNPNTAEYERHAPKLISKVPEHLILKCKKEEC